MAAAVGQDPQPSSPAQRKGERTRGRILEAARICFGDVGYERATIRAIAEAAGIDKSSVIQYFGSKAELFREAVDLQLERPVLARGDARETAQSIVEYTLERWSGDSGRVMTALVRAGFTSDTAADELRGVLTRDAVDVIAAALTGRRRRLRAALIASFMFGVAVHRAILRVPDIAGADDRELLEVAVPVIVALIERETE